MKQSHYFRHRKRTKITHSWLGFHCPQFGPVLLLLDWDMSIHLTMVHEFPGKWSLLIFLICLISLIGKIEDNSKIHIGMHNIKICNY